jgi:hypothetical protein
MARPIDPGFGPCDSILFLALGCGAGRACTLVDVISLYDWVNRDIPTAETLDGGLNRLLAAGLIRERRGGFYIPVNVLRKYNEFRRRRRRDRFVMAEEFVRSAGPLSEVPRRVTIRPADQRRAYEEYHRRFRAALKKTAPSRVREGGR